MTPSLPKPPSSEPKRDLQPEPTANFLVTLLSSVEPPELKGPEEDWENQESRFLDTEDWDAQRTLKEISHLQNACMRLQESLSSIQAENLVLREKLENLPDSLFKHLKKEMQALQEDGRAHQQEKPRPSREQGCCRPTGSPTSPLPAGAQRPAGSPARPARPVA